MTALSIGRPRFVTLEEAMAWQETAVAQFGGSLGLRDKGLLESALAQPQQGFGNQYVHEFPFGMAAAYAYHLAKNHPFVDGNKRAALMCCGAFLRINGWDLVSEGEQAADAIVDLVNGKYDKVSFAAWLERNSRLRPSMELRDFFRAADPKQFVEFYQAAQPDAPGNTGTQFQATADEVAVAMPLIHKLLDNNRAAVAAGDERLRVGTAMMTLTLCALYRLAEDMGYEW